MEFFLINHPLDCPICDQAGECGLQDYSFKHGVAYSRFQYEDKRTYPGRERIPLGANVILNMNRCIQCTRCVRFTQEVAGTGELGFFNRGARAEIGTFPGKPLDNPLATCVVDICPVGALTSTRFRFAERVWYLDKKPSICTGCEVGCNITMEHRRGDIKRYKPRYNVEVNDYWMCDYGRATFERYKKTPRLTTPRVRTRWQRQRSPAVMPPAGRTRSTPSTARLQAAEGQRRDRASSAPGFLTCEEAYLFGKLADAAGSPHRSVPVDLGPEWTIPRFERPPITGREAAPNRRGAELAGLAAGEGKALTATTCCRATAPRAARCWWSATATSARPPTTPETVARLRQAKFLVVFGWADSPLAQAADVALPVAHHGEKDGTFVNVEWRVQRFERAFPPPGQTRPAVEVLGDLLSRFDAAWANAVAGQGVRPPGRRAAGLRGLQLARPAGDRRRAQRRRRAPPPFGPGRRGGSRRPPRERRTLISSPPSSSTG